MGLFDFVYLKISESNTLVSLNSECIGIESKQLKWGKERAFFDYFHLLLSFSIQPKSKLNLENQSLKSWHKNSNVCLYGTEDSISSLQLSLSFNDCRRFGIASLTQEHIHNLLPLLNLYVQNRLKFKHPQTFSNSALKRIRNLPLVNLFATWPASVWYANKNIVNTALFSINQKNSLFVACAFLNDLNTDNLEILRELLECSLLEFSQQLNNSQIANADKTDLAVLFILNSIYRQEDPFVLLRDLSSYKQTLLAKLDVNVCFVLCSTFTAQRFLNKDPKLDNEILEYFNCD
jgi:hypothetical protein